MCSNDDFIREISLMKHLGVHPHIVKIIGYCAHSLTPSLVLEYMPHGNLRDYLRYDSLSVTQCMNAVSPVRRQ